MKENSLLPLCDLCRILKLSFLEKELSRLLEEANRQNKTHLAFLQECLEQEVQDKAQKRTQRLLKQAQFPFCKTLENFNFAYNVELPEVKIRQLIVGEFVEKAENIIFLGEPGTGKTHLAIAIGMSVIQKGFSVKFITIAQLVNLLNEARNAKELSNVIARFAKPDLLIIDELGYVPLTKLDAELFFQVLTKRQENCSVMITTNLPFSEWVNVFTDPRLCKAILDRLTYQCHIIETGIESVRLAKAMDLQKNNQFK